MSSKLEVAPAAACRPVGRGLCGRELCGREHRLDVEESEGIELVALPQRDMKVS